MSLIVADERMVTVDLPRNIVFYSRAVLAFVLMLGRSVHVFIANWQRRGYSVLERPVGLRRFED
jgi:hypothetical protein